MSLTGSYENSENNFEIKDYFMSNKTYDVLKFLVQMALPAFGTLYFTLASIWGLPPLPILNQPKYLKATLWKTELLQ